MILEMAMYREKLSKKERIAEQAVIYILASPKEPMKALLIYILPINYRFQVIKKVLASWCNVRHHLANFFFNQKSLDQSYTPGQGSSTKVGRLAGICINRSTGYLFLYLKNLNHFSLHLIGYLIFIISFLVEAPCLLSTIERSGPGPAVRGVIRGRIRVALKRHAPFITSDAISKNSHAMASPGPGRFFQKKNAILNHISLKFKV